MSLNRIVVIVTAVLSLAVGLLPAIANLDWTSTAGILASLGTVAGLVLKWLDGWQKHEARVDDPYVTAHLPQPIPVDSTAGLAVGGTVDILGTPHLITAVDHTDKTVTLSGTLLG